MLRFLDWIADWLVEELDARAQLRFGVALVLLSIPLFAYMPWSNEPPLIYLMSAGAITLTGIGIVLGAEVLEQTEDTEETVERHCAGCSCSTSAS